MKYDWTDQQTVAIQAPPCTRMLVDAGPGTGKTATLCSRIAWLIDNDGINPSSIWVVSFTRTAVNELRNRIGSYLKSPSDVYAIRIATIDAYAWSIQSGFILDAQMSGTFEDNIHNVITLVKENKGVFEYISSASHLFVDEAQDIVGPRVELILELINAMPAEAGVTIFSDEAQGIYDFARDGTLSIGGNLPENIRSYMPNFSYLELTKIHRTTDSKLINLYLRGRDFLRSDTEESEKNKFIRNLISEENHGNVNLANLDADRPESSNSLVLFRSRGDTLSAATKNLNKPFRLRVSGFPHSIFSWIGIVFWDCLNSELSKSDFTRLWQERLVNEKRFNSEMCWDILIRNFGKSANHIDVRLMNQRLSSKAPPIECCDLEYGLSGPIFGTIHASKGREAQSVYLHLPPATSPWGAQYTNFLEEARVLFVGATRAKEALYVCETTGRTSKTMTGGRAYTEDLHFQSIVNVEVGRVDDVSADGLVGRKLFQTIQAAKLAQTRLKVLSSNFSRAKVKISNTKYFDPQVYSEKFSDAPICFLSQQFKFDMKRLGFRLHSRYYQAIEDHVVFLGVRTLVISEGDSIRSTLWDPWRGSGFMLAPMLVGYPKINFTYNPI